MTYALPPIVRVNSPNYSSRGGQKVRLIVAHDCEGNYAGSVSWFAQARSQVSAHLILREDGGQATQMVSFGNKAWHVCNFNPFSEGIEAAGFAAKGLGAPEFASLAAIIAWRLKANEIACQEATAENDWTGFTEHWKLGAAGGGHHDFTENPDIWAAFVKQVEAAYAETTPDVPVPYTPLRPTPPVPPGFQPSNGGRSDEPVGTLTWAQMQLNALGMARPPLTVDGIEGRETERALAAFQATHHLYVDGLLGPQTIKALAA